MESIITAVAGGGGAVLGFILGYIFIRPRNRKIEEIAIKEGERVRSNAKREGDRMLNDAERQADKIRKNAEEEENRLLKRLENKEKQADERSEKRLRVLEEKIEKSEEAKEKYELKALEINDIKAELNEKIASQNEVLEGIANLSQEEARKEILERMEKELAPQLAEVQKRKLDLMREEADTQASEIIVQSIQRFASSKTDEATTSTVKLASDDIKGKIIGREGRNINAFEMITGVNLIIDDAPGSVTLSSYDMYRRYIAKITLERLLKDGRIHPGSIEETLTKVEAEAEKLLLKIGKDAAEELNISGYFPDEILSLVGRLRFRTSYGQNVLAHSKEVAWLGQGIAYALPGSDPDVLIKAGLVHDIGKAVSHEVEGGHAIIGMEILEKFGVDKAIIQAMKSHHEDFPYETIESRILQAADAISAARPGARRETLEKYIKRLKLIEGLALESKGVKKAYCIHAGREVRAFVNADHMSDAESQKLSFELARKIESKADYPGEVKVVVIRENRYVDKAK